MHAALILPHLPSGEIFNKMLPAKQSIYTLTAHIVFILWMPVFPRIQDIPASAGAG